MRRRTNARDTKSNPTVEIVARSRATEARCVPPVAQKVVSARPAMLASGEFVSHGISAMTRMIHEIVRLMKSIRSVVDLARSNVSRQGRGAAAVVRVDAFVRLASSASTASA